MGRRLPAFGTTALIDPVKTREVLAPSLSVALNAEMEETKAG
jgi:hypothetical protein